MSEFDLKDVDGFQRWRDWKLARQPRDFDELVIEVEDPARLSAKERAAVHSLIQRCNFAAYASRCGEDPDKNRVRELGQQFGLSRLDENMCADSDAISALAIADDALHAGYIPYTNRPISWHTDGYYNSAERQIRGLILHCVRPADQGGSNQLMDHEMAYLLLRERNPDYIAALTHPQAMCIPPNEVDGTIIRPEVCGPVFSTDIGGNLHMRYTARRRNITWRDDALTRAAANALSEILSQGSPYHFKHRLEAGQGLICNNILHTRSGFEQDSCRLLYRARYFDRISEPEPQWVEAN